MKDLPYYKGCNKNRKYVTDKFSNQYFNIRWNFLLMQLQFRQTGFFVWRFSVKYLCHINLISNILRIILIINDASLIMQNEKKTRPFLISTILLCREIAESVTAKRVKRTWAHRLFYSTSFWFFAHAPVQDYKKDHESKENLTMFNILQ